MRKGELRIPNLDGRGEPGSPGVEAFLEMIGSHVAETPITPPVSSATMLPSSGSQEERILLLEGEVIRLKEENSQLSFSVRNLEAAVFGQRQLQPSAKKQKH